MRERQKEPTMQIDRDRLRGIVRRWAWLVIACTVLAGAAGYGYSAAQTPRYLASALMQVNPSQDESATSIESLEASQRLAETYSLLIETGPVLERVIDRLGLPFDQEELESMVSAEVVSETQLVRITVEGTSPPDLLADIANSLVEEFQAHNTQRATNQADAAVATLETEISSFEQQISDLDARIEELEAEPADGDPGIQQELETLRQQRTNLNQTLTDLNTTLAETRSNIIGGNAQVELADPARAPSNPFAPRAVFTTLLCTLLGLLIGLGLVVLIE